MKKLLLISLVPFCMYASEREYKCVFISREFDPYRRNAKQEDTVSRKQAATKCITSTSFTEYGKSAFNNYVNVWHSTIVDNGIPCDSGLAKIVVDMYHDGITNIINNAEILKITNDYLTAYEQSPSARIENIIKGDMAPCRDGSYCFDGAQEELKNLLWSHRQLEYINILSKRHEAPIVSQSPSAEESTDQITKNALNTLRLNVDNASLKPSAIRAITLLLMYHYQNDHEHT